MRVPIDWLSELVELPAGIAELAERLTGAGFEVERVEHVVVPERVVAGLVIDVRRHPRAESLALCRVVAGQGAELEVVCGAPDAATGRTVALALPGAVLPGGVVEAREVAGFASAGVICSERELGLTDEHGGLLDLAAAGLVANGPAVTPTPGTPLGALLPPVAVLEVSISPNRGDCLSILGMAREVSALWGARLLAAEPSMPPPEGGAEELDVASEAQDLCPWYCVQRFATPTAARAPLWMRRRLVLAGLRPISPAVDVTNYVMLERGQPMHAFDQDRLHGGRLVARRARAGETIRLLDGREPALTPNDLVIADASGAVALAGVMGGANSEVGPETRRIALESAMFAPSTVRRTARRVGAQTEASFRFERGVDPTGAALAVARAAELLTGLGARRLGPLLEAGGPSREPRSIAIDPLRINALLGTSLGADEMERRLRAIGAQVHHRATGETIEVTVPAYRNDLRQAADLAEEIARVGGYEAILPIAPRIVVRGRAGAASGVRRLQAALAARGFAEAVLLAFAEPVENERFPGLWPKHLRPVELLNPLATMAREMRRSLLPGLLGALRANQAQGESFVALFSIGTVFARDADGGYLERTDAAALVWGSPPSPLGCQAAEVGFLELKRIVDMALADVGVSPARWVPCRDESSLHPGRSAELRIAGDRVGRAGAAHPALVATLGLGERELWLVELDTQAVLRHRGTAPRYVEPPRFPSIERDVALVVDDAVEAHSVIDAVLEQGRAMVEKVELFDEYRGAGVPAGRKSLAYRISYRARDRTLTDAEVNVAHDELVRVLAGDFASSGAAALEVGVGT